MFTLCIPTLNRFDDFLSKNLPKYLTNELITEIIITDENGNDVNKIKNTFTNDKLKLFINEQRLGPFSNKISACSKASNEWIVLIDSDNFAEEKNIILAPSFAKPNFNYSYLAGFIYKKGNFHNNKNLESSLINASYSPSTTLMNTGNYIINKYLIDNLNLSNETENIKMSSACDVIYFNTLLFEQLDLNLHVVSNLEYEHVVHNGSVYIQTHKLFAKFNNYVHHRYNKLI